MIMGAKTRGSPCTGHFAYLRAKPSIKNLVEILMGNPLRGRPQQPRNMRGFFSLSMLDINSSEAQTRSHPCILIVVWDRDVKTQRCEVRS